MNGISLYSDQGLYAFRDIIEQAGENVMVTGIDGIIQYVNPTFERTTGFCRQDALGKTPRILRSGQQTPQYYQQLWSTILAGRTFRARTINKKKNGQLYVADQTISPVVDSSDGITHFVSIWRDITQIVRCEERLRSEKTVLEEIIGLDEELMEIRNSDHLVDFVVARVVRILGVEKCSVMLVDSETQQLYTKSMAGFGEDARMTIDIDGSFAEGVVRHGQSLLVMDAEHDLRLTGKEYPVALGPSFMIVPIKVGRHVIGVINVAGKKRDPGQPAGFDEIDLKFLFSIAVEMAVAIENVSFCKELHHLAVTDPLTGAFNYRYFANDLEYELKRAKRFRDDLSLVMVDIDGFKAFNEQSGYPAGDELLKGVSRVMRYILREVDVLCRYGHDEFVLILPGTGEEGAFKVAEKIRRAVQSAQFSCGPSGSQPGVTVSVGVAHLKDNMTRHELACNADKALYQAKSLGENRVCVC